MEVKVIEAFSGPGDQLVPLETSLGHDHHHLRRHGAFGVDRGHLVEGRFVGAERMLRKMDHAQPLLAMAKEKTSRGSKNPLEASYWNQPYFI